MEECLIDLLERYPCREEYFTQLYNYFGNPLEPYPPSLYIQGPSKIGKTTLLKHFLNHREIRYAYMDCVEYYTAKMLFEDIINIFAGHRISSANKFENYAKCDTMEDFIEALSSLDNKQPYVVILKNYERLAGVEKNILPVFVRLSQMLMKYNFCCILIGCKPMLTHASIQALPDMLHIHCGQYSKTDLTIILQQQEDFLRECLVRQFVNENSKEIDEAVRSQRTSIIKSLPSEFYSGYLNVFLSVFYTICRNVRELLYLSNEYFPTYCHPVIAGTIDPNDLRKLWKNMEIPFQRALNTIYCRMKINRPDDEVNSTTAANKRSIVAKNLELPYFTKFLLIAAYLASHNEAKSDKRLFMKYHGKERKRMQSLKAKAKVCLHWFYKFTENSVIIANRL